MLDILKTWFSLSRPVDRRFYALSGFGLAFFKYAVDALLVWLTMGVVWSPLGYLHPTLGAREAATGIPPPWVFATMAAWSLPFYWIGISMSVRRVVDAGLNPAWGLLYFVPIVNYLLMLLLCVLPSGEPAEPLRLAARDRLGGVMRSAAAGTVVGFAMMVLSVVVLRGYGASLFLGTPFVMGFVGGFLYNRDYPKSPLGTLGVAYLSIVLVAGVIALAALEGLVCLMMALPLAMLCASLGAILGRQLAIRGTQVTALGALVLALPILTGAESRGLVGPVREVATAIEVDRPPEAVWPHVIGFSELPPPSELVFRLGIAYPMRARIAGAGPGAVRTCEFSTGAFVEPITVWDPARRLGFDVRAQPEPMHEWSPYQHVDAPHLVDGLRSERGEFRLVPLAGGRTRLEGSTWYRNNLFPQLYWNLWSDALIHSIHRRVLEHVKSLAETTTPS